MHCIELTTESQWKALQGPWNELARWNPMLSFDWLLAWWHQFGENGHLRVLAVLDGDQLVGALPLYEQKARIGTKIQYMAADLVASDYLTLLAEPQRKDEVIATVNSWITESMHSGSWRSINSLRIDGIANDDPWIEQLQGSAEPAGISFRKQTITNSWPLSLPSSWDEFLATHRKRSVYRKAKKVASRLRSGDCNLKVLDSIHDLDLGLSCLIRLHQARRTSVGDQGCFADHRFEPFLREALSTMLPSGKAIFCICESNETPIGVQLLLLGDETAYLYQAGIDPEYMNLEPGHTMIGGAIMECIQRGFRCYDFLRGDEGYKSLWGAQPISLARLTLAPPTLKAQATEYIRKNITRLKAACR